MKYPYEDLSEDQFECLIVFICQHLLGIAVQPFAKGPDGGRDAKFVGTAELYPSKAAPWTGTTIIQAKHTIGYNLSFSDQDFFSPNSSNTIIGKEIPRIKKLRNNKQLDNYMLFANRRLTGIAEDKIRSHIAGECKIPEHSICLCGIESLEIHMKTFPAIAKKADFDPIDSPLIVSPDDLAEVVETLAHHNKEVRMVLDNPPTPRISFEDKNKLNNMTVDFAKELRRRYLKETEYIRSFLAAPENSELLEKYEESVEEFQLKILAKRADYQNFDAVMLYLMDLLLKRDAVLRKNKRLTRAVLFYMYWNCDLGKESDA